MACNAGNNKWTDAAVRDLTFAVLMSNSTDGTVNIPANWDNVLTTMNKWGYTFTKGAMSQHWTKRILKDFKERHAEGNTSATASSSTTSMPRGKGKRATASTPKTPASASKGKGKGKRAATQDDDDESNNTSPEGTNSHLDATARNRGLHSFTANKKVKYEEEPEMDDDGELTEQPCFFSKGGAYKEEDPAYDGV